MEVRQEPNGGSTFYSYDSLGRVEQVIDPSGYTERYTWDALNRRLKTFYPDGSARETIYENLDPIASIDRQGRRTVYRYNALRQLTYLRDPAGNVKTLRWCRCGQIEELIDGLKKTRWDYYPNGLLKRKTYPNGNFEAYSYDSKERLSKMSNGLGTAIQRSYYADGSLARHIEWDGPYDRRIYRYAYDTDFQRLTQVSGPLGATQYSYHPYAVGRLGAGRVHTITGPLPEDQQNFEYDALGRVTHFGIASGYAEVLSYDALGRVSTHQTNMGTFTHSYQGSSHRLSQRISPSGQRSQYQWLDAQQDFRLAQIQHQDASGQSLSTDRYSYNTGGQISTWQRELIAGSISSTWHFDYDAIDQLTQARQMDATAMGQSLRVLNYRYDASGNRSLRQDGPAVTAAHHNEANQLTHTQGGGWMRFSGTVNQVPQSIELDGHAAQVDAQGNWSGYAPVQAGSNQIALKFVDRQQQMTQKTIEVDVPDQQSESFEYDAAGNLLKDKTCSYRWSRSGQLLSIRYHAEPGRISEFSYNHSGQRVKMKESWRSQWLEWTDGMTLYNHSSEPINVALQGKDEDESRPRTAPPVTIAARSSGQLSFPYNADSNCGIICYGNSTVAAIRITVSRDFDQVRSEFMEHPDNQRDLDASQLSSERSLIYRGYRLLEERSSSGQVHRRHFPQGVQQMDVAGTARNLLYLRDHLGSITSVVDDESGQVIERYAYSPWGRRSRVGDTSEPASEYASPLGYTGHWYHEPSELHLTHYRAYDAELGRWLSRDPIAENGGINLYAYVGNNPVNYWDPLGESAFASSLPLAGGAAVADGPLPIGDAIAGGILTVALIYDLFNESQADDPGPPKEADGYKPPKKPPSSKDGKVRNPNGQGRGWPDKNGNVWTPTGHGSGAHGGPHWDVQHPDGSHTNVYPGGKCR